MINTVNGAGRRRGKSFYTFHSQARTHEFTNNLTFYVRRKKNKREKKKKNTKNMNVWRVKPEFLFNVDATAAFIYVRILIYRVCTSRTLLWHVFISFFFFFWRVLCDFARAVHVKFVPIPRKRIWNQNGYCNVDYVLFQNNFNNNNTVTFMYAFTIWCWFHKQNLPCFNYTRTTLCTNYFLKLWNVQHSLIE